MPDNDATNIEPTTPIDHAAQLEAERAALAEHTCYTFLCDAPCRTRIDAIRRQKRAIAIRITTMKGN